MKIQSATRIMHLIVEVHIPYAEVAILPADLAQRLAQPKDAEDAILALLEANRLMIGVKQAMQAYTAPPPQPGVMDAEIVEDPDVSL